MKIVFYKQARKELEKCPTDLITDVLSLIDELAAGVMLSMPISRPLPSIAKGLHELRLSKRSGEYRVFYAVKVKDAIYVIHITQKKTQKTDQRTISLIQNRLKDLEL